MANFSKPKVTDDDKAQEEVAKLKNQNRIK